MHKAASHATRTIAVLSADYFASKFTSAEWAAAFRRDPRGEQSILIPVRVRRYDVEGLLGQISYIDLVDLDEATAKRTLLEHLSRQRRKPMSAPPFPSSHASTILSHPPFPGTHTLARSKHPDPFPPIWNVPYRYVPFFTGRDQVVAYLFTTFTAVHDASAFPIQALIGLGGLGKTQTAVAYAYRYRQQYRTVLWVRAETEDDLLTQFKSIAELLNRPATHMKQRESLLASMQEWFRDTTDWLLVLDNADNLAMIEPFLPVQFDRASAALLAYSLLHRNADATLDIHRLVQTVLRDDMSPRERKRWMRRAVYTVASTFPSVEFVQWTACERWLPHARVCNIWIEQEQMAFPFIIPCCFRRTHDAPLDANPHHMLSLRYITISHLERRTHNDFDVHHL